MTFAISGASALALVAVFVVERARATHQISQLKTAHQQQVGAVADDYYHQGLRRGLLSATNHNILNIK